MAAYLPDDFIDNLREQTDIVEVIGQHVELRKRGQNWLGLCPFHTEKTPSFNVTPSKGIFKCFGCGKGGDVYSFLMEHQQLSFHQAVEQLAERAGMPMPRTAEKESGEDSRRKRLFYANQYAAEYYHRQLVDEPAGKQALDYLTGRGLGRELIDEFELGWAPKDRRDLKKAAIEHGIDEQDLLAAGLVMAPEDGGESFDRFRGRVLFPIRDSRGRTVGFGGRVLDDGLPKYLNTSDTDLFHKGEVLFGLDKARGPISREETALVVEGYMDLLSLRQHGVTNAVAPLGTALTQGQARLLSRYAREVFLLYDADSAGLRATFRGGDELLAAGVAVRVATLPKGTDPDDYVRTHGADEFASLLDDAADLLDRKIEILRERLDLAVTSQRERAADKCLETVARVSDQLVRQLYLQKTAEFIGVPLSVLTGRLDRAASRASGPRRQSRGPERKKIAAEDFLLALCIEAPEYIERAQEKLGEDPFGDETRSRLFGVMREAFDEGVRNIGEALYASLPEEAHSEVSRLRELQPLKPAEEVFDWCWRKLELARIDSRMREIFESEETEQSVAAQELERLRTHRVQLQQELPGAFWLTKY